MSLRVNHNMSAVNAHRNVVNNSNAQTKTMEKLSSGLKINRARIVRRSCRFLRIFVHRLLVYASPSTIPRWLFL